LNGNPFLLGVRVLFKLKSSCKKDWEWKADKAAPNITSKEMRPNLMPGIKTSIN